MIRLKLWHQIISMQWCNINEDGDNNHKQDSQKVVKNKNKTDEVVVDDNVTKDAASHLKSNNKQKGENQAVRPTVYDDVQASITTTFQFACSFTEKHFLPAIV